MKPRILIVDDEDTIRYFLKLELEQKNYEVWDVATGTKALKLLETHSFDVALLDLRLPDVSGQEIMQHLKRNSPETGIIIITAYATLDSAIDAVKHDAHDYILKPFNTEELLASIATGLAQKDRQPLAVEPGKAFLSAGPLNLNPKSNQILINDEPLKLTPTEHDLLVCFMKSPNTALDSVALLQMIRGYKLTEFEAKNIVRVHIHRLRHKLEAALPRQTLITTMPGGRYLLAVD